MKKTIKLDSNMLLAIESGKKTQFSAPMEEQPKLNGKWWEVFGAAWGDNTTSVLAVPYHSLSTNCPYGQFGDVVDYANTLGEVKGKLKIVKVWIQRVNEIGDHDIIATGIDGNNKLSQFSIMWILNYGSNSWVNNDWSWFINFEKVE